MCSNLSVFSSVGDMRWYILIDIDAYWYIIIHNPWCWNSCSSIEAFQDILWSLLSLSTAGASFHGRVRLLDELGRAPAHPCFNEMSTLPLGQNHLAISTLTWYHWRVLYDILSISRVFETFPPTIHLKMTPYDTTTPQCRVLRSTPPLEPLDIGLPRECRWVYLKTCISQAAICTVVGHAACKDQSYSDPKFPLLHNIAYVCISVTFESRAFPEVRSLNMEPRWHIISWPSHSQRLENMAFSGVSCAQLFHQFHSMSSLAT